MKEQRKESWERTLLARRLSTLMGGLLLAAMLVTGREIALCIVQEGTWPENWQQVREWVAGQELVSRREGEQEMTSIWKEADLCVVLDPGHGGADPGKVGQGEILEKDLNLQITHRVKAYLEQNDIRVVMTRSEDEMLGSAGVGESKKLEDMRNRVALIEENKPEIVVSIHQNSYPSPEVRGAQVFYHEGSAQGSRLAGLLQESLVQLVDPDNKRKTKADSSYYLLKNISVPVVIVECGFLSNQGEAAKLTDEKYQDRLAWAIHMGIMQYLADSV